MGIDRLRIARAKRPNDEAAGNRRLRFSDFLVVVPGGPCSTFRGLLERRCRPRIFPAALSTGGSRWLRTVAAPRITPAAGTGESAIPIPSGSGLFWAFPGLVPLYAKQEQQDSGPEAADLVVSALAAAYGAGEARGKLARGRAPTCGWWKGALQPHARNDARIGPRTARIPARKRAD